MIVSKARIVSAAGPAYEGIGLARGATDQDPRGILRALGGQRSLDDEVRLVPGCSSELMPVDLSAGILPVDREVWVAEKRIEPPPRRRNCWYASGGTSPSRAALRSAARNLNVWQATRSLSIDATDWKTVPSLYLENPSFNPPGPAKTSMTGTVNALLPRRVAPGYRVPKTADSGPAAPPDPA